jgi:hypothetical protein
MILYITIHLYLNCLSTIMEWYFKTYYQFLQQIAKIYNFNPFIYTSFILFLTILLIIEIFKKNPYIYLDFSDIHKWKDEWKCQALSICTWEFSEIFVSMWHVTH